MCNHRTMQCHIGSIYPVRVSRSGYSQNFSPEIVSGLNPDEYLTEKLEIFIGFGVVIFDLRQIPQGNYIVSQKNCTPKAGRHKFCYFPNTKIRNIRFVGNFILNKSCEFYYDDVTMTSFIGNKWDDVADEALRNEQHAVIYCLVAVETLQLVLDPY